MRRGDRPLRARDEPLSARGKVRLPGQRIQVRLIRAQHRVPRTRLQQSGFEAETLGLPPNFFSLSLSFCLLLVCYRVLFSISDQSWSNPLSLSLSLFLSLCVCPLCSLSLSLRPQILTVLKAVGSAGGFQFPPSKALAVGLGEEKLTQNKG